MMEKYKGKYRVQSTRLPNWDYTNVGWYYVTICTQDRVPFFGNVSIGEMHLSPIGEIARAFWLGIPNHFPHVDLDEFVVMPNHVHGIIIIRAHRSDVSGNQSQDVGRSVSTRRNQTMSNISPKSGGLGAIVRSYKSAVTRWAHQNGCPEFVWQPRFYDHIIRNEESLKNIREYIQDNPSTWESDRSKIIAIIVLCGVAMPTLLISQYTNLNAQSAVADKAKEKLAYQAKGKKMPDGERENREKQSASENAPSDSKSPDATQNKESKGDANFYRVVVENNLFRPLGWQRPNREPQYTLIGTMIEPKGKSARAFLIDRRSNQYYAVALGEKVGDATVKKISSDGVTINNAGEMMTIRGESNPFLSGSGRESSEHHSPSRENRPDRDSEDRGDEQPNRNEINNRFKNASPEERKRMLEKYRKAYGNKMKGGDQSKGGGQGKRGGKSKDNYQSTDGYQSKSRGQSKDGGGIRGK